MTSERTAILESSFETLLTRVRKHDFWKARESEVSRSLSLQVGASEL